MTKGDIIEDIQFEKYDIKTLERLTNNNTPTGMLSTKQEDFVFKVRDYDLGIVLFKVASRQLSGEACTMLEVRSPIYSQTSEYVSTLTKEA